MMDLGLALLILVVASMYASVGLAGSSGYLAVMAFGNVPPEMMKPAALALNCLVAAVGTVQFGRSHQRPPRLFWPILLASTPMAFLGGLILLPGRIYQPLIGALMLVSAYRMARFSSRGRGDRRAVQDTPRWAVAGLGAGVGLIAGLTGTGGGILLHPMLQMFGWTGPRQAAAIVAPMVLLNSMAALAGHVTVRAQWPAALPLWAAAALVGGLIGSWIGSRRLRPETLRRVLAVVLLIAGVKLLLSVRETWQ